MGARSAKKVSLAPDRALMVVAAAQASTDRTINRALAAAAAAAAADSGSN